MRTMVLVATAVGGLAILLGIREVRLSRQIELLRRDGEVMATLQQSLTRRLEQAEADLAQERARAFPVRGTHPALDAGDLPQLERQIRALQAGLSRWPAGLRVPEYDPTRPQPEPASEPTGQPKRGWGPEQAIGPPDTMREGDAQTAWASLQATAGAEWLAIGLEQLTEVAEVRVRETCNPGAISKVAAMVDGAEVVLWEGTSAKAAGMRDFVVPVSGGVHANSIVVHLDTSRVASWPKIDAVELVGHDGGRQWASSASASSTYAK